VREIAEFGLPKIELVSSREKCNQAVERYRAFVDVDVDVCLVRDIDSILSKTDSDLVNNWLMDPTSDILRFWEYKMCFGMCMGGGIGLKKRSMRSIQSIPFTERKTRGEDEQILNSILKNVEKSGETVVATRMLDNGTYCLFFENIANQDEDNAIILWTTPFFDLKKGYASSRKENSWLEESTENCVLFCKEQVVRREHVGAHLEQHREKIINCSKWIR
jgi:hypothetical protein